MMSQIKKWSPFLFLMVAALLPSLAFAGATGTLFPIDAGGAVTNDKSIQIINQLFDIDNLEASPFADIFVVLNSAILMLGGVLVSYSMVVGTIHTAHSGEMLGKKWSSAWLPIRTAAGTALILPASSGFCTAQIVVIWLLSQGIGMANMVWVQFADTAASVVLAVPNGNVDSIKKITYSMIESNICIDLAAKLQASNEANGTAVASGNYSNYKVKSVTKEKFTDGTTNKSRTGFYYGDAADSANEVACGSAVIETPDFLGINNAGNGLGYGAGLQNNVVQVPGGGTTTFNKDGAAMVKQASHSIQTALYSEHEIQFVKLQEEAKKIADAIVADPLKAKTVSVDVDALAKAYNSKLELTAKGIANGSSLLSGMASAMKADGWVNAGTWFMMLSRVQDAFAAPLAVFPGVSKGNHLLYEDIRTKVDDAMTSYAFQKASGQEGLHGYTGDSASEEGVMKCVLKGSQTSDCFTRMLVNNISSGGIWGGHENTNPILATKAFGDNIIATGWSLLFMGFGIPLGLAMLSGWGGVVVKGVEGVAETVGGPAGSLIAVKKLVSNSGTTIAIITVPIAITIMAAGASLSVVIPFLPYTIWLGVVFGWIILCIEAVIAAPLWAIVHIHPDGDEVVGKGGQGYMLVFSLIMRPALMVIGLVAALAVMPIFGKLLNDTFFSVFSLNQADSATGPVTAIAVIGVYVGLMLTVVKKSCALIHVIPDEILKWIGGNAPQLGQHANEMSQGVESQHRAVVGGFSSAASSQPNSMAQLKGNSEAIKTRESNEAAQGRAEESSRANALSSAGKDFASSMADAGRAMDNNKPELAANHLSVARGAAEQMHALSGGKPGESSPQMAQIDNMMKAMGDKIGETSGGSQVGKTNGDGIV